MGFWSSARDLPRVIREVTYEIRTLRNQLSRTEKQLMAQNEQVTRLIDEVAETQGQVASIAAFVRGVPALVRQAVEEALAANPDLTAEDLAAITKAADDLDAAQAEIVSALQANTEGVEDEGPGEI